MITNIKLDDEVKTFIVGITLHPSKTKEGILLRFIRASYIYSAVQVLKNQLLTEIAKESSCANSSKEDLMDRPNKRPKLHFGSPN